MDFPGDNEMKLSNETVEQMIRDHVTLILGGKVRIDRVKRTTSYGLGVDVEFTTDPIPEAPPAVPVVPPPPITRDRPEVIERTDDSRPF